MKEIVSELYGIVHEYREKLLLIPEETFSSKPLPGKWSKKEVVGHLIDSAHNNLRRFIAGQYDNTSVIVYDQEFWVVANGYQQMRKEDVIQLWRLLNERIGHVLSHMPEESARRELSTSKDAVQVHSLQWLASDYIKHMKHHLNQVFQNAFDISYP